MKAKKSPLGKGLDSLYIDNSLEERGIVTSLNISHIEPNKAQPRKHFDEEELAGLAASIRTYGIIQPILVKATGYNKYQIIAGERRWRAARIAELGEVPVVIRDFDESDEPVVALIENLQRVDLNAIEEAEGYRDLMEQYSYTHEAVATALGKSRSAVTNSLRLLHLPEKIMDYIRGGEISGGHGRTLLPLCDNNFELEEVLNEIIGNNLSVRDTEKLVKDLLASAATLDTDSQNTVDSKSAIDDINNIYIEDAQRKITEKLGRKVRIKSRGERGRIEIDYSGTDDLNALLELLENG
jgi:ParB family chromosome partitioning protein